MPTRIAWTEETWNPVTGCRKVSPGCDHCYAERLTQRWGGDFRQVTLHPERLDRPLSWRRPRLVFTCSMADLFCEYVPLPFICQVFDRMIWAPQHTFQILTKRPGRMVAVARAYGGGWPCNAWAGVSVESTKYLPRLDVLARVPAAVRFVSCEPLLGPLDLRPWFSGILSWVIVGGESGPGYRPMLVQWVQDIAAQCHEAGVPLFVKQDSGAVPGKQGRLPDMLWGLKQMPMKMEE